MKRLLGGLLICALSLPVAVAQGEDNRPSLSELVYPAIDTTLPVPERTTLNNGVAIMLIPDHELPLVTVSLMFRAGSLWDPVGKEGLASLAGSLLRGGGSASLPPAQLDATVEEMAASLETSIGQESGSATLSVMSKDLGAGLSLLADIIRHPRFDQKRFTLSRARMIDAIRRQNDDPTTIASRELNKALYHGSPYGAEPTMASVAAISRDDLIGIHKKFVKPTGMIIGVSGDFDKTRLMALLNKTFGDWAPDLEPPLSPPPVEERYREETFLADKDIPQGVIRMGHLGVKRTNPDYFALRVLDKILGGNGFASRLPQKVRTEKGLAYSVWSYYLGGRWAPGRFVMGADSKTESVAEVVTILRDEVKRMRRQKVSAEELMVAKNSIANSFIFIFDRPSSTLGQWMVNDYYRMGDSYLLDYRNRVMAVTADDVLRVAKKYLHPNALTTVVVGRAKELAPPLSRHGKIIPLNLASTDRKEK